MESRKTRRSSILKPPKPRNPLSELEPPNDNTTTRLTRRVSFASSNFIKEFAADPEQNTIWNVTYEEIVNKSDSTQSSENAQSTRSSQQAQQLMQTTQASICSNHVKNKSKQVENHDLVANQPQQSTTNETSKLIIKNVSQTLLPEDQVAIKTNCQNKTAMENCDMDLTQIAPTNISAFNKTFANNSTMDFTNFNFIPALNSTTIQQDQKVKLLDEVAVLRNFEIKDVNFSETSMDITDIPLNDNRIIETKTVIPLINIKNLTEIQDIQAKKKCLGKNDNSNLTKVFHESMDVTENMGYNFKKNLGTGQNIQRERNVGNIFNKTVILNESMEFTQKVPTLPSYAVNQSMEFRKDVKTKLFNESSEFTEPISLKQYNFENLGSGQNQQSDGTEKVTLLQNILEIAPSQLLQQEDNKAEDNQTNLFNESMEFTHQVPPNFGKLVEIPDKVPVNFESFQKTLEQDADKIVNITRNSNKSMEFTQKLTLECASKIMENQKQAINENPSALFESIDIPNEVPFNPESVLVQYEQKGAIQQNSNCTTELVQEMSVNRETFNSIPNLQIPTIQDQNVSRPKESKFTYEDSSLELNNKEFLSRSENVSIPKIRHENLAYNLESSLKVDQNLFKYDKSQLVQKECEEAKLFSDGMKFTEAEDLKKTFHHQSGGTQNEAILQKKLEIAPSRFDQKEYYVKTKLFNDSAEFLDHIPANKYDFDESENLGNVQNQQIDGAQNVAKIQTKLEIGPNQFIQKNSIKFTHQIPSNDGKLIENPDEVLPMNPESSQKMLKQNAGKSMEFTEKVTQLESSKIMGNQSVQKQTIYENRSKLFESIEIPNEVSLNPQSLAVKHQQKANINQNLNCTQFAKEISLNAETFNSLQLLQISQIKDLNVSCPKVFDCSVGVAQEASLSSAKLNQKQEESLENIDKSKKIERTYLVENEEKSLKRKSLENIDPIQTKKLFLGDSYSAISLPEKQQNLGLSLNPPNSFTDILTKNLPVENQERSLKRKSEDNFDISPSNKPFRSDCYEANIKYESEKLLDDTTIQLCSDLESSASSDCSALPIKKPILSFSKPEIPFRPKLREFEAYLEKVSVEVEKSNEAIKELNEELLREMTLPSHAINFDIQRIDFDALQNYSFESDLTSDESSTDGSLFRINSDSIQNDENLLTISEKIHRKHSRCKEYCSIVSTENSKCILDTLFGSIRLEVHFNDETGAVNKIEIYDRLSDKSELCALLAQKVFRDTLSLRNIRAAVGEHYDILTLMDYIYMNMQKVVDFLSDWDTFAGRFGLKMDSNFSVKFNIVSLPLKILWWITVDLSDMENISENSVNAFAEVGALEENKIKMFVNNCPRGITFLSAFINNILSHIELLKTQRRRN